MKKLLIGLAVLVVLLAGGIYAWYRIQKPTVVSEPLSAIPTDAVLVVNYPDINALWDVFEEQDYHEALLKVDELDRFFSRNLLLDSIIRYNPQLKTALGGSDIWSSYHVSDSDSLSVLLVIKPSEQNLKMLTELSEALGSSGIVSSIQLGQREGFKLVVSEPYYSMYVTMANGLILMASSESLLSRSIAQLSKPVGLLDEAAFASASKASGKNVEANVFINYSSFPRYLNRFLKPTMLYSENMVSEFASWTELDVSLKDNGVTCNGFTYTTDSLHQFMDLFLNQEPQSIEFPNNLPTNTASFIFYGIEDLITFVADYRDLLSAQGKLKPLEASLDSINTKYGIDLEQNILAWMGKSYGVCITEPKGTSFAEQTFWIFDARSSGLAKKLLFDLGQTLAEKNGDEVFEGSYNGIEIGQLKLKGIISEMFGDGYDDFSDPYFAVLDDMVVFGASEQSLQEYLQFIQADRTLAKDLAFTKFTENLGSHYNIFTYHHLGRAKNVVNSYLNREAIDVLEKNKEVVGQFEAVGTQITTTGKSFYSNVFLKYNPLWKESVESYWKARMDAEAQTRPIFVKNHVSGEDEILVQDKNNMLYLFNSVGQELFRLELPEPIESEPKQVDAFKNGKLQFVFNTKNFIYLVDRDGKNVGDFPVELDSPAETDLAVIEYDKKRDYRLLISCKNKKIYNYEITGKKTSGWRHNKAPDPTIQQFKHMFVRGKDHLITGESNGKIHLLDRRGKNRVQVEDRIPPSKNNHLQTFVSSETAFTGVYITNDEGLIHRVALDGEVQSMDLGKFSPEHQFIVADLDADGGPEFIFHDLNLLQVFSYKKQKLFETRIAPSASEMRLFQLEDDRLGIGFHYQEEEQLVLFSHKGEMVQGFPLSGNSEFDLLNNGSGFIVVSAGSGTELIIQPVQ